MTNEENQSLMRHKIIYSFTGSSIAIFKVGIGAIAIYYFSEYAGIPMAAISLMLLITRVWDAINDPLFGLISDITPETKVSKDKIYYLSSAILGGLAFYLMYSIPAGLSESSKITWMYISYISVGMMLTVSFVSEFSIFTKMTNSKKERTTISILKSITGAIGGLLIMILVIPLVNLLGNGDVMLGYSRQALLFSVYFVIVAVLVVAFVPMNNREAYSKTEKISIVKSITVVWNNKFALFITLSNVILAAAIISRSLITPFFAKYIMEDEMFISYVGLSALLAVLLVLPFSKIFIKKYGILKVSYFGLVSLIIGNIAVLFVGLNLVGLLAASFFASIGMVLMPMTLRLLLAEAADYGLEKYNQDSTGMIGAVFNGGGKLANTVTPAIIIGALGAIGFISAASTQTPAVKEAIVQFYTYVPALISTLIFIPLFFYSKYSKKIKALDEK